MGGRVVPWAASPPSGGAGGRWRRFAGCLVGSCLALAFAATSSAAQMRDGNGSLRIGLESGIKGFDPVEVRVMGIATLTAATTMLETLLTLDEQGRVVPHLAQSLEPSADGLSWTARLRPGIAFHDGTPLDAAAVAFHFRRLLDPANACPCRTLIAPIERVEAVDARTVRFHLAHPWAALPVLLAEPSVVSLIGSPTAYRNDERPFNRHPVGTGPFRLQTWGEDRLVVERNPAYWREGVPRIHAVELRVLPDQQARMTAVRAGDLDLIWTLAARDVERARRIRGLEVHEQVGLGARLFVLNTREPPLDDPRVRRALAHALDMDLFAKAVSRGLAPKATDPFGPGSPYQCGDTGYPAYDPARARELLTDYGRPVRLTMLHTATPRGRETGQILQQLWKAVGVELDLEAMEQAELLRRILAGDYQVSAWRFRDSLDPDPDLYAFLHSRSRLNVTGIASAQLDRLVTSGRRSPDPDVRRDAYCAIARLLNQDVPLLYGTRNAYFAIARERVRGLPPLRGGLMDLGGVWIAR